MMRILYVVRHYLKRMLKRRALVGFALGLPVVCGVLGTALPEGPAAAAFLWTAPVLCALTAWGWIWLLVEADCASGMSDAVKNTPLPQVHLTSAKAAAGAVVYLLQICLLMAVLAVGR